MTQPVEWLDPGPAPVVVAACCSGLYANPLAELLIGESLHPGGLASTRRLLRASGLGPGARILDARSGRGATARLAADEFGLTVDAVDASAETIRRAAARTEAGRIRWRVADLALLPFDGSCFDGVVAECVLSTTDRPNVLRELARVIVPGGVLTMSDIEAEIDAVPAFEGHRLLGAALCVTDAWRPGELEASLSNAGFRLERRWDLTASILELVDRAESRVVLARIAARDLGLDLAMLADAAGAAGDAGASELALDPERARKVADDVRAAVRQGQLRYFGSIAVRMSIP